MKKEAVLIIKSEGGSLTINRNINEVGTHTFELIQSEIDNFENGNNIHTSHFFQSFNDAFFNIDMRYPWYELHLELVHDDYKNEMTKMLINNLNKNKVTQQFLQTTIANLQFKLGINLVYGSLPMANGLKSINIDPICKVVEY